MGVSQKSGYSLIRCVATVLQHGGNPFNYNTVSTHLITKDVVHVYLNLLLCVCNEQSNPQLDIL